MDTRGSTVTKTFLRLSQISISPILVQTFIQSKVTQPIVFSGRHITNVMSTTATVQSTPFANSKYPIVKKPPQTIDAMFAKNGSSSSNKENKPPPFFTPDVISNRYIDNEATLNTKPTAKRTTVLVQADRELKTKTEVVDPKSQALYDREMNKYSAAHRARPSSRAVPYNDDAKVNLDEYATGDGFVVSDNDDGSMDESDDDLAKAMKGERVDKLDEVPRLRSKRIRKAASIVSDVEVEEEDEFGDPIEQLVKAPIDTKDDFSTGLNDDVNAICDAAMDAGNTTTTTKKRKKIDVDEEQEAEEEQQEQEPDGDATDDEPELLQSPKPKPSKRKKPKSKQEPVQVQFPEVGDTFEDKDSTQYDLHYMAEKLPMAKKVEGSKSRAGPDWPQLTHAHFCTVYQHSSQSYQIAVFSTDGRMHVLSKKRVFEVENKLMENESRASEYAKHDEQMLTHQNIYRQSNGFYRMFTHEEWYLKIKKLAEKEKTKKTNKKTKPKTNSSTKPQPTPQPEAMNLATPFWVNQINATKVVNRLLDIVRQAWGASEWTESMQKINPLLRQYTTLMHADASKQRWEMLAKSAANTTDDGAFISRAVEVLGEQNFETIMGGAVLFNPKTFDSLNSQYRLIDNIQHDFVIEYPTL